MAKKNKNADTADKEVDMEKLDRYVSRRSGDELYAFQVKKSVFFILSTAFLLIAIFLPSDTSWHGTHKSLVSVFSTLNVIGLIYALYMFFQDNRKHKIQKTVLKSKAPHYGYNNKFTFLTYEIFVIAMLFFLVEQCVIVAFARDVFAIVGLCLTVAAFGFAVASRFMLVIANSGQMELIEANPESEDTAESAGDTVTKDKSIENTATQNKSIEDTADDFYAPVEGKAEQKE